MYVGPLVVVCPAAPLDSGVLQSFFLSVYSSALIISIVLSRSLILSPHCSSLPLNASSDFFFISLVLFSLKFLFCFFLGVTVSIDTLILFHRVLLIFLHIFL